ncbi:Zn-ribbon domain-containing OB-fold protein [Nocardioides insulae]|uniref:Zn-ribbon domain-containing OB-fold protein n=1 Tax=Nocardioides insulae TaxID=394734 RepID=UPI00041D7C32|nr:OB-fold domain-containing protein [Nocardioides insulae]
MSEPLVPIIERDDSGPYLVGTRCRACEHVFVGPREACARCTERESLESLRLADSGRVYVWTVVHRSFPGVATPFIDAIVDLDDGSHLKGTLADIDPDAVTFDLPVRVEFREEIPAGETLPYLTYVFVPSKETGDE